MVRLVALLGVFVGLAGSATAGPIFSVVGLPGSYTPGDTINFTIQIAEVTDLAMFDFDLRLSSTSGTAGSDNGMGSRSGDFGFVSKWSAPATSDYVFAANRFPMGLSFRQQSGTDAGSALLSIRDFNDEQPDFGTDGVTVPAGSPRLLAEASIFTTANAGDLQLSFGDVDLFGPYSPITSLLTGASILPPRIDTSGSVFRGTGTISAASAPIMSAPEPSAYIMFGTGLIGMAVLLSRRGRRTESAV